MCKGFCKSVIKSCKDLFKKFDIMLDLVFRCKYLLKEGVLICFNGMWLEIKDMFFLGEVRMNEYV